MARRRSFRRRVSWFGRGKRNPAKKISVVNIFAAALAMLGIGVPVMSEAYSRYTAKDGTIWKALTGAGDVLSVMFLGRAMDGTPSTSTYKYQGWYIVAGSLGIVAVNRLLRTFAGRIPIWGRFTVN